MCEDGNIRSLRAQTRESEDRRRTNAGSHIVEELALIRRVRHEYAGS